MTTINYQEHPEFAAIKHRYEKMEITSSNSILENAHLVIVPPVGMFQTELNEKEAVTSAATYITNNVAKGSSWTNAAKIFAFEGHDPNLVRQTKAGFSSLISQHDPVIELPSSLEYLLKNSTVDGKDLAELYVDIVDDVLTFGRSPILIDPQPNNEIRLVKYHAINMPDWGVAKLGTDDQTFSYAILIDYEENPEFDPLDATKATQFIEVVNYHHLENGIYVVNKYKLQNKEVISEEKITPTIFGKVLNTIPLICIGSLDNTPDVDTIPLEGISNCSIKIFSLTATLSHAERASAVPTFVMSGVDNEETPDMLGANILLPLADSQARAYYTTTDTSAMQHIQARIDGYYMQAQELGASLLGSRKGTSESGEALRLRQASSTASLKSTVDNVGKGVQTLLEIAVKWLGLSDEVKFEPNKEFSTFALTANETIALVQAWQAQAFSHSTLLEQFRKAGMLKPGETVEDELENLKKPGEKYVDPALLANSAVGQGNNLKKLDVGEGLPTGNNFNKNV